MTVTVKLVNGAKLHNQVAHYAIEVRNPLGGWKKVLDALTDEPGGLVHELRRYPKMHLLLLMDFDGVYSSRYEDFSNRFQIDHYDRMFLLGIDQREAEDLKKTQRNSFEYLGKALVEGCPDPARINPAWNQEHLR